MSLIKIESYIDIESPTEVEALVKANALVNVMDNINNKSYGEVVTKLYYIAVTVGKLYIIVSEEDRIDLGVDSNILSSELITNYPLVRLPSQVIEYRELMIKKGSLLTDTEILNAAQALVNNIAEVSIPKKMPIVKIINYNTTASPTYILPSGYDIFSTTGLVDTDVEITNNGDPEVGQVIIDQNTGTPTGGGNSTPDIRIETKIFASDGENFDSFGQSVSANNKNIVVGAPDNNNGAAYIYNISGTEEKKIVPRDGATGAFFGYSVSMNKTTIVVGAYGYSHKKVNTGEVVTHSGAAYLFSSTGGYITKITAPDLEEDDNFGRSVSISTNRIVIGAYKDDDNFSNSGSAYIYDIVGNFIKKIKNPSEEIYSKFGEVVFASNNRIIVGAPYDRFNALFDSGKAYIFDLSGNFIKELVPSDIAQYDRFGTAISANNTNIAISSIGDNSNTGAVYIYNLDGTEEVKITADDAANSKYFGSSIDMNEDKIVVGSTGHNNYKGKTYIFDLFGSQLSNITADDAENNDYFGISTSISDYNILVGSAHEDVNSPNSNKGSAYIYNIDDNLVRPEQNPKIKALLSDTDLDFFGMAVKPTSKDFYVIAQGDDNLVVRYDKDGNIVGSLSDLGKSLTTSFGVNETNIVLSTTDGIIIKNLDGTNPINIPFSSDSGATQVGFGKSLGLSSSAIFVSGGNKKLFVYDLDGTNERTIEPSNTSLFSNFGEGGFKIILNKLLVLCSYADNSGTSIVMYDLDGTNEVITPKNSTDSYGIAFDYDGTNIYVGAPEDYSNGGGAVKVYNSLGALVSTINTGDGGTPAYFGYAVSVANNRLYVGSPISFSYAGAVFSFNLDGTDEKTTAMGDNPEDYLGMSLVHMGDIIVMSSPGIDTVNILDTTKPILEIAFIPLTEAPLLHNTVNDDFTEYMGRFMGQYMGFSTSYQNETLYISDIIDGITMKSDTFEKNIKGSDGTPTVGWSIDTNSSYLYAGTKDQKKIFRWDLDGTNELIIENTEDLFGASLRCTETNLIVLGSSKMFICDLDGVILTTIDNPNLYKLSDLLHAKSYIQITSSKIVTFDLEHEIHIYNLDGTNKFVLPYLDSKLTVDHIAANDTYIYTSKWNENKVNVWDYLGNLVKTILPPQLTGKNGFGEFIYADNNKIIISHGEETLGRIYVFDIDGTNVRTIPLSERMVDNRYSPFSLGDYISTAGDDIILTSRDSSKFITSVFRCTPSAIKPILTAEPKDAYFRAYCKISSPLVTNGVLVDSDRYEDGPGSTELGSIGVYDMETDIDIVKLGAGGGFGRHVSVSDNYICTASTILGNPDSSVGQVSIFNKSLQNRVDISHVNGQVFGLLHAISDTHVIISNLGSGSLMEIYMANIDGSNLQNITPPSGMPIKQTGDIFMMTNTHALVYTNRNKTIYSFDMNGTHINTVVLSTTISGITEFNGNIYIEQISGVVVKSTFSLGTMSNITLTSSDNFRITYSNTNFYVAERNHVGAGKVHICDLTGAIISTITSPSAKEDELYGTSVAVSDNNLFVGASNGDGYSYNTGVIYVYDLDGTHERVIYPKDDSNFGLSIKVENNKLLAICPDSSKYYTMIGNVEIFDLSILPSYLYNKPLRPGDEVEIKQAVEINEASFGEYSAINETNYYVYAPKESNGGLYVYTIDGSIAPWRLLSSDIGTTNHTFGKIYSSAVSNSKIAVQSISSTGQGAVYVYNADGTNEVKIVPSNSTDGDGFGNGIAINDNKIVISAPNVNTIYLYDLDGTNELMKQSATDFQNSFGSNLSMNSTKIILSGLDNVIIADIIDAEGNFLSNEIKVEKLRHRNSKFGSAIASNEEYIVVGDYDVFLRNEFYGAAVYVYNMFGELQYTLIPEEGKEFGVSVDINSSRIIVGDAKGDSFYIYSLDGTRVKKGQHEEIAYPSLYGKSVSLSDSKILVGAPIFSLPGINDNSGGGFQIGAVYLYDIQAHNFLHN